MDLKSMVIASLLSNVNIKGLARDVAQKVIMELLKDVAAKSPNKLDDAAVSLLESYVKGPQFEAFLDKLVSDIKL